MSKFLSSLMILIILSIPLSVVQGQETTQDGICTSVFDLMENNTVPYFSESASIGGGALMQSDQAQSVIMPKIVYADFWSFQVDEPTNFSVEFAGTDALEFNLFYGLRAIWSYRPLMSAQASLKEPGIYTLVLRRINFSDSKEIEYQIYAKGAFSPPPQTGSIERVMGNPNNANPTVITDGIEQLEINGQIFYGHPGSILGAWENPPGQTTDMRLSPNQSPFYINTWAQRVGFLGGDLVVFDDSTPRYLYVERFDSTKNYRISNGNLNTIHDQDLTNQELVEMEISNWELLQGVWVFEDCLGVVLKSGQKFVGEIDPSHRSFRLSGTRNDFRVQIQHGDGQTYDFTFDWDAIHASEGKVWMSNGVVYIAPMVADKVLELQTTHFVLRAEPATDLGTIPIVIQIGDNSDSPQVLEIDWRDLDRVGIFEDRFEMEFNDGVRTGITVRPTSRSSPENPFVEFRARDEIVHIRYADGAERLMLPRSEGFVELITPGGTPFFDPTALPDEHGYLPRGLNNLGGECYSVNTALPEANCPLNGYPNPSNGNLWYAVTDLIAYGGTFDLALTRSYNSRAADQDGPFGPGWATDFFIDYPVQFEGGEINARQVDLSRVGEEDQTANYDPSYIMRLDLTWAPRGLVIFRTASGSRHAFTYTDTGWQSYTMPGWRLTAPDESPYWVLIQAKGDQAYDFDRAGRLRRYGSPSTDRWIEIDYPWSNPFDTLNKLVVSDAKDRRKLEIFFNEDHHIEQAVLHDGSWQEGNACTTDANCFETKYVYDEIGNLVEVTYYDGLKANYVYDEQGHITWHNDPRAPISPNMAYDYTDDYSIEAIYILKYDTTSGQVRVERDELDAQLWRRLSYQPDNITTVVDEYNLIYTYTYDVATSTNDWRAGANNFTLKSSHNSLTDVSENFTWENGQLVSLSQTFVGLAIKPLGDMRISYDEIGSITQVYLPQGHSAHNMDMLHRRRIEGGFNWQFDDGSHLILGYDEIGDLVAMQSRTGASYQYEHLTNGIRVTRSDDEMIWEYHLDSFGLVESVEQFLSSSEIDETKHTISYKRDAFGRLIRIEDSVLGAYTMTYTILPCDTTSCSYKDARLLISMADPTGTVTRRYFDAMGQIVEECLGCDDMAEGFLRRTTYIYDEPMGRLIEVSRWLAGTETGEASTALTTSYIYERVLEPEDDGQNPDDLAIMEESITEVGSDGRRRIYIYDALGRIRSIEDEWGHVRSYDYEFDGSEFAVGRTDVNMTITEYNFYRDELREIYRYNYDIRGQIRKVEHRLASEETWRTVGNFRYFPISTTALDSFNLLEDSRLDKSDAAEIIWMNPAGPFFTSVELKVTTGDSKSKYISTIQPAYDYLGRITQTDHPIVYCVQSDGGLRMLHLMPDVAVTETPCLDYENGKAKFVQQAIDYDVHGRVIRRDDSTTTYNITYIPETNPAHWRVNVHTGSTSWELHYNPAGDLVYWRDEIGTEHFYDYDTLGRLVAVTVPNEPEASFTFTYNDASMLKEMYDGLGRGTRYEYDDTTSLLVAQQDAMTQAVTTYTYGDYGLLSSVTSPSGYTTTYLYEDPKDPTRLTNILTSNGQHDYVWGTKNTADSIKIQSGRLRYTNPRGEITDYIFDKTGLLREVVDAMKRTYALDYDRWGNLILWSSTNQQFDLTPIGQTTRVSVGDTWAWRFEGGPLGQLRSVVGPNQQTIVLDYDAFGQLKMVTVGREGLTWVLDRNEDRTISISTPSTSSTSTFDTILSFDQLYRLVSDGNVSYDYNITEDGEMELIFVEAGNERKFTFFAGESDEPAKVTLDAPGQRITYTYNDEHLLAHITREVCIGPQVEENLDTCVAQADDTYLENLFECLNEEGLNEEGWQKCEENPNRVPPLLWTTTISFFYDANDRPIRIVDQANNVETFSYDETGNLAHYQNRRGETFTYFYDDINRLESLTGPSGVQLLFEYNALDQVTGICRTRKTNVDFETCVTDGGMLATFDYDTLGRMIFQGGISYGYDSGLLSWWDKEVTGQENEARDVLLSYHPTGLVKALSIFGQTYNFEYVYDIDGTPYLTNVIGSGEMAFEYAEGRVSNIQSGGYTQHYTYDASEGWAYSVDGGLNLKLDEQGFLKAILGEFDSPLMLTYKIDFDNAKAPFSIMFDDKIEKREIFLDEYDEVRTINYFQYHDSREKFEPYLTIDYTQPTAQSIGYTIRASEEYLSFGARGGYQIIIGQDLAERPLSMRIIDRADDSLLYSATYTYDLFGRREAELRHYSDGTRFQSTFLYDQNSDGTDRIERRIELTFPSKTKPLIYTYIYEYDEFGNLIGISQDGTESPLVCATYEYDGANRLVSATFPYRTSDDVQHYSYDAFNRLVSAGSQRYVYQGMSQVPLLMEDDGVVFYAQLVDSPLLFAQDGQSLHWFTHDGQVFTFNPQVTAKLYLFDPLGNSLLESLAGQDDLGPCDLIRSPLSITAAQPTFDNMIWDAKANLYFINGRAYDPALGRFLQRNPLGPDALGGGVYQYPAYSTALPIREREPAFLQGLQVLADAVEATRFSETLTSEAILAFYQPAPISFTPNALIVGLQNTKTQLWDDLEKYIMMPKWLKRSYNLPDARIDPNTGAVTLPSMQDLYKPTPVTSAALPTLHTRPWQPSRIGNPNEYLTMLISAGHMPMQQVRWYKPEMWRPTPAGWRQTLPSSELERCFETTPSAIRQWLPQWLDRPFESTTTLALTQMLTMLPQQKIHDWLQTALSAALPAPPSLPHPNAASWRDTWFSTDLVGLENSLRSLWPVPTVDTPVYQLGVNPDWLYIR